MRFCDTTTVRIQRNFSLFGCSGDVCQKCAEWGIKELSWAERGRRVGHKKLPGGSHRKGWVWSRDLVSGQAHGGWGSMGREKEGAQTASCVQREREQECGAAWEWRCSDMLGDTLKSSRIYIRTTRAVWWKYPVSTPSCVIKRQICGE